MITRSYFRNIQRLAMAGAIVVTLQSTVAFAQAVNAPSVPPELNVPRGHRVYLKTSATGTQNYICLGSGWTFLGPQATLFVTFPWIGGTASQQVATHYLSPNPQEEKTPRATWQSSLDTSAVWAKAIASSTNPEYVAPGAIAWLLLQTTGVRPGPMGGTMLSDTTYIQRVNTSGGVIPTGACTTGATAFVPYTTDYYFFEAN